MRRIRLLALAIGLISILGACAQDDPALEEPEATEATDEGSPAAGDGAAGGEDIELAAAMFTTVEHDEFGEILVTNDERTLYVFLQDTEDKSNCSGACAETWPPLLTGGEPVAEGGVDESLVATIERDNEQTQVTYNGHPLYLYAADEAAGDTKGQGVGGNWYVVSAEGEPVKE